MRAAYSALFYRARRRGIEFTLTRLQFANICEQTGYIEGKGVRKGALHIDRIDPARGYTWDNCQVITCSENVSKGNRERANGIEPEQTENEPF